MVRRNTVRPPNSSSSERSTPVPPRSGSIASTATTRGASRFTAPCWELLAPGTAARASLSTTPITFTAFCAGPLDIFVLPRCPHFTFALRAVAHVAKHCANGSTTAWRFTTPPSVASITRNPSATSCANAASSNARSLRNAKLVTTLRSWRSPTSSRSSLDAPAATSPVSLVNVSR